MRSKLFLAVLVAGLLLSTFAAASDDPSLSLEGIEVKGKQEDEFVEKKTDEPRTESTVTKKGLELLGTPAQTMSLKALDLLPSIEVDTPDAYGFVSRFPFTLRSRGELGIGMGYMFEGVPVWGEQPPGPRPDMFDMENIKSTTFYRGAVPVDKGLGAMNTAGAISQEVLKPADDFGVTFDQAAGTHEFTRSFLRLDTGTLPTGTKLYGSYSFSEADKWKGDGGAPDYRHHVSLGAVQDLSSRATLELYGDYHETKFNEFRALNFAQATNIGQFRSLDYNGTLTGTPAQDINYYGYNMEYVNNINTLAKLEIKTSQTGLLSFRPYYWNEHRYVWSGSSNFLGSPAVDLRYNDLNRYGGVLEYKADMAGAHVLLGYWYELQDFFVSDKMYRTGAGTGALAFNSWVLIKSPGNGEINSPYVNIQKDFFNRLHVDAGLRYINIYNPAENGYLPNGLPDVSFNDVFNQNPQINPNAKIKSSVWSAWVPNLGLRYKIDEAWTAYANYGRNYARPAGFPEMYMTYINNQAKFTSAGVTLQHLMDRFKLETSNNYDLGFRFSGNAFYMQPSIYYAEYNNKRITVFDPTLGITAAEGDGKTTSYGAELELGFNPTENFLGFSSFTYTNAKIDENIQTALNSVANVKGMTVPDTPAYMGKLGVIYRIKSVEIAPIVKYYSPRFGDAANTQKIPGYAVADLNINYRRSNFIGLRDFAAGVSLLNLFDTKYIGMIRSFDDQQGGATSYYAGAPFTAAFTIGGKF